MSSISPSISPSNPLPPTSVPTSLPPTSLPHEGRAAGRALPPTGVARRCAPIALALLLAGCAALDAPPATPAPTAAPGSPAPSAAASFVRPTLLPSPTPLTYTVVTGDTLTAIARRFATTPRSIAMWNRGQHPSLDPDAAGYDPDRLTIGWRLVVIPGTTFDGEPSDASASPTPATRGPVPSLPPGPTPAPDGAAILVAHASRSAPAVALTFESDAPTASPAALALVDRLVADRVPATLFVTGRALADPSGRALLERIAGHPDLLELGNHGWDSANPGIAPATLLDQLSRAEAAAVVSGATTRPFFRPGIAAPLAPDAALAIGRAGWDVAVAWDVDPDDGRPEGAGGPTTDDIVARVLSRAQPGSIVRLRLDGPHTLEALPRIVAGLEAAGLAPVSVRTLLGR